MAIKFFKVLGGLSKLFNKANKKADFSNLATAASNKGINENSIVHVTATDSDTAYFGARYLPDTSVLYVNGQPHIDSKNILFGISMQVYSNVPVFIAPIGLLKATDTVKVARIRKTNASGQNSHGADSIGLTIPDQDLGITLKKYAESTSESSNMEKWAFYASNSLLNITGLSTLLNTQDKAGAILTESKIAFSIWRNDVQISDWFPWYFDGTKLKIEKGLYLPGIQDITYQKLVEKVSNQKLVPGRKYRITDYKPTSAYWNIIPHDNSASIIVTAISANKIDENATYRDNYCQCQVKYSLTRRTHSAGLIYNDAITLQSDIFDSDISVTRVTEEEWKNNYNSSLYAIYNDWMSAFGHNQRATMYAGCSKDDFFYVLVPEQNEKTTSLHLEYVINLTQLMSPSAVDVSVNPDKWTDEYTGEIYYMKDEYGNEANYDFKGYRYLDSDGLFQYTFGGDSDRSLNGDCANNKFLDIDDYKYIDQPRDSVILGYCDNTGVPRIEPIHQSNIQYGHFANYTGTSSEFLMADGSVLNGIKATATAVTADEGPSVTFDNRTFNFKIPSGTDGETGTRGSKWYQGTTITGTSTTATKFTSSGITDALAGDKYLNTSTSNVYECVTGGNAANATWKYIGNIKGAKGDKGDKGDTGSVAELNNVGTGEVVTGLDLNGGALTVNKGSVGGRNLLLGSCVVLTSTGNNTAEKAYTNIALDFSEEIYKHAGETAYLSVDIKLENALAAQKVGGNSTTFTRLGLIGKLNQSGSAGGEINIVRNISTTSPETIATRLTKKITIPENATSRNYLGLYIQGLKSGTATVGYPKLELGSVPTDWSVAPEEGDLYTGKTPTISIGGLEKGVNYKNKTMSEMFETLLCPYVRFSGEYASVNPSEIEYNTKPKSITYTAHYTAGSETVSLKWDNNATTQSITIAPTTNITSTSNLTHTVTISDGSSSVSKSATPTITYRWFFGQGTTATPDLSKASLGTNVTKGEYSFTGNASKPKIWLIYPAGWGGITVINMGAPFNDYTSVTGIKYNGISYTAYKFNNDYTSGNFSFTLQ